MKNRITFILIILGVMVGCNDDESNQSNNFDIEEHLENIFDNGIIAQSNVFIEEANSFQSLLNVFNTTKTQEDLNNLQSAWRTLKLAWEPLEVLTFGVDVTLTGKIVSLDSWPINTEEIIENIAQDETVVDLSLIRILRASSTGLVAMEYLLFEELEFFTTEEFADNRMNYLIALSEDIIIEAQQYREIQLSNEESFKSATSNSTSGTQNQLINSMILKLDEISMEKIGSSLGLTADGTIDSSLTESPYGEFSLDIIERDIQQIESIFTGLYNENSEENGLYAQLRASNRQDLVNELTEDFQNVYSVIDSFNLSLEEQLDTDSSVVLNLVDIITELEITVKNDVASTLNVVITFSDNDGD